MSETGYIKSLDGVRAIAIILVMTYHADITHFGWMGVQLFFVLSGFLITGILWKEKTREGGLGFKLKKFWVRRSLRIFPLYFGYILAITGSYLLFQFPSYFEMYAPYLYTYTVNFTRLLPNWEGNPLFTHLWSLSIEEQFYLIFPLFIFLTPKAWVKRILIAVILLAPVFRWWLAEHYYALGYSEEVVSNAVNFHTVSHLDAFSTGGLIPVFALYNRVKYPMRVFGIISLIGFSIGAWSFFTAPGTGQYLLDLGFNHWHTGNFQHVWLYTVINFISASLLLLLVNEYYLHKLSLPRKWLENRWMVNIGRVSYGMYLFHWIILVYIFARIYKPETLGMKVLYFIPYLIAVYLFSELSYRLFEVHFIKMKDRFFRSPAPAKKVQEQTAIS